MPLVASVVVLSVVAGIFSACAMAIIRGLGKRLVGYRPTWRTGFWACFLGYWISMVFGGGWARYHPMVHSTDHLIHVFLVYGLSLSFYPFLHMGISVSGHGRKPTIGPALFLAGVQVCVGIVGGIAAWGVIHAGKST